MVKVDLITGFLGSGKTTFLKKYAKFLMNKGMKIGILENDYGAVNVDMMLLGELEGESCALEMVSGACDADCHKRRFKTKLIAMGMSGYDRVLIEPSGIFDVDEFFDSLYESPLDRWYEIGSVIAVVDANLSPSLSENSEYLLASQAAGAGTLILSKTRFASEEEINASVEHVNSALEKVKCERRFTLTEVVSKNWDELTEYDFEKIMNSGYRAESYVKRAVTDDGGYKSVYFMNTAVSADKLEKIAAELMNNAEYGHVFRIKGFVKENGEWLEFNATRNGKCLCPIKSGQDIVIVIGEDLKDAQIRERFYNT